MAPKAQPAAPTARPKPSLPAAVSSPADVGRLARELKTVDDALLQLSLRSGGTAVKMPKTSQLMDQLIQLNKLNLLKPTDRAVLGQYLAALQAKAPVLHISFGADPSAAFLEKLTVWLRLELHPQILVTIGLQPNIGAGCVVRSTNKYFDLSLRQSFADKRGLLLDALSARGTAA